MHLLNSIRSHLVSYVDQYMMSYVINDCEIELMYFLHTHQVARATDLVSVQL